MEVHAHTHTSRKKWTHYFWEFIMLFLAVFCGFLAEYKLEHMIEHQREKQYMRSMIEDLKSDTSMLYRNRDLRISRILMMDSLVALLSSPERDKRGDDMYFYARSISPPTNIFPNNGTTEQLKSSGNLRLIRKSHISNSIMTYDQLLRNTLFEMGDEVEIRAEYRQLASKIFDTKVFHEIISGPVVEKPSGNPLLYKTDPDLINEYIGAIQYFKRVHQAQLVRTEELLKQALQLMELIKSEYNID